MRVFGLVMLAVPMVTTGCGNREKITGEGEEPTTSASPAHRAAYTEEGALVRPHDWREWVFVGMPVTPNALNGGKAILPEAQAVYIDPTSWEHWKDTGTFRDGTMFAVELTLLKTEGADVDGSTTEITGRGFFQDNFAGLQFAIKDSERFAEEPGNWAYFSTRIGAKESDYPESMVALPTKSCNSCHQANGGQDWVFTQFYPVLRAAKPKLIGD